MSALLLPPIQTLRRLSNPGFARTFFAATSNRRLRSAAQIAAMLVTSTTGSSALEILLEQSFKYRLIRWLYQSGHPPELRSVLIPEEVFMKEENDALARANLLLRGMTDSELLPLSGLQLVVRAVVTTLLAVPCTITTIVSTVFTSVRRWPFRKCTASD
jgi:hypothetical protein